jgi:putative peptide zinc metalloprotease protein
MCAAALAATALAAGLVLGTADETEAAAGDNAAVAVTTRDGTSVYRVSFRITRENGDVVSSTNAAVAYASCVDCAATAIAFQVVLVTGDPAVVAPANLAIAVNEGCSGCETLADAHQFVRATNGQVHFTADGNQALAGIRRELRELRRDDLSVPELEARLDAQLVAAGSS